MRIAITGIGVVSTFGVGREIYWDHIRRGVSGTRAITEFDATAYPCQVAAAVPPVSSIALQALMADGGGNGNGNGDQSYRPVHRSATREGGSREAAKADLSRRPVRRSAMREGGSREAAKADPKRYSRAALFGVVAALEAWRDAGLDADEPNAGVIIGTGGGGIDVGERQYHDFFLNGGKHVTPYAIALGICGMVSSEISIALGLHGISHVLSTGCTSSTDAIGYAAMLLRSGEADVLVTGGTDGCVLPGMIFGFSRMRAVSTHYNEHPEAASRPFDRGRDGFVLGEGAWMLTLERVDRARARGARIYATIDGYASTCDAYHRVQMDPDGEQIIRCMTQCIARSGRALEEIGYISYHGTSTQLNDTIESQCTRSVFGAQADRVPGSSIKSMIGHPQGASGAAGVVASALALSRGFLPPTINLTDQDPQCDLDFVPNAGRAARPAAALCNCLGFGSKNSALVLGAV